MFPRYSAVLRFFIVPVIVFIVLMTLIIKRDDVSLGGVGSRDRLPWNAAFLEDIKQQQTNLVAYTTRHAHAAGNDTQNKAEFQGNKTAVPSAPSPYPLPHNFNYILNPSTLCSNQELYMVIYIHTSPNHFHQRQIIRQTWANPKILKEFRAKIIFVTGMVAHKNVMNTIQLESSKYGDIVQEDFLDAYKNLTYKGIAALKWIHIYCNKIKYVLKADDDMLVNFYSLTKQMETILGEKSPRTILCCRWNGMPVIRQNDSKWYVPKEEFASDVYSTYCSGSAFVISGDVIGDMFNASLTTPFFWVDDFYITGLLANKTGIKHKPFNDAYFFNGNLSPEKLKNDTDEKLAFYHVHNLGKVQSMWRVIEARHRNMDSNISFLDQLGNKNMTYAKFLS